MTTTTQVLPEIQEDLTEPDGLAHYTRIRDLLQGGAVVALCGKKYVPTVVGPAVFNKDICPPCAELMAMLASMDAAG